MNKDSQKSHAKFQALEINGTINNNNNGKSMRTKGCINHMNDGTFIIKLNQSQT